jgi:long-chain acyl-CoA synthetase
MDEGAVDLGALPQRIHDSVDCWAAQTPDAPALLDGDARVLTYAALRDSVTAMAAILANAGVRGGDRVLIVNENSAATVAALFAASRLDAWAVLINARLAPVEIDRIRRHAQPRAIVFTHMVSQEAAAHAIRHDAAASITTVAGAVRIAGGLQADPEPVAACGASQVAAVIYTSGTTGNPKGVMLTHRNLLFTATASGHLRRIVRSDFVIQLVPVAHVFGLASVLLCAINAGAKIALVPRFDPARLADALQSGITVLQGVPAM